MWSRLYLRLYFSAVAIMVTSVVMGTVVTGALVFNLLMRPDRMLDPFQEHMQAEAELMRDLLLQVPADQQLRYLEQMAQAKAWDVSLWRQGKMLLAWGEQKPSAERFQKLIASPDVVSRGGRGPGNIWLALPLGEGWLVLHPRPRGPRPPGFGPPGTSWGDLRIPPQFRDWLLALLGTLVLMTVLLIPFVRRIVRPFQELLTSIRRVSVGHYETPLELAPGSEFEALATEFNHMTDQIQKTLAEKQRLIADVSHELRSPLARLRVSLELMVRKGQVPEKYHHKAVAELEHLDDMIDDLLDASRLELRARYAPQMTELGSLLDALLEKNRLLFAAHPLKVLQKRDAGSFWCQGDPELLERAFNNIFSNTLKHTPPEGSLEIVLERDNGWLELRFRDSGPGIDPADTQRIFEPFFRTDDSRTRATGGAGLGLAIVRKIMDLHSGEVWAGVPEGGGMLIGFRLPERRQVTQHLGASV
ncbi:MAG: ATP-binding protein [Candidatus Sericytochromatia bacterium]